VSFALGAFFAGMILAESPLSQRAAEETLPLRDAFAVLFFVSVGMLFNPYVLLTEPLALLATLAIIIVGKSVAAYAIVRAFGRPSRTAFTIAASLAQIGEFSFILATLGTSLKLIPADARDLILAGAILSILLNPVLFMMIDRLSRRSDGEEAAVAATPTGPVKTPAPASGHVILVGFGRVGRSVATRLVKAGETLKVIETDADRPDLPESASATVIEGNAASVDTLRRADIDAARIIFVAIPQSFEAGQVVEQARKLNPAIRIVARAHSSDEVEHLRKLGADLTIMGEEEIASRMVEEVLPV
jgi:CPA2 family monovalent cation:H+ antiporter-2